MQISTTTRQLRLPAELLDAGIYLREERVDDYPILAELYRSVRWEELLQAPWDDAQKIAFLDSQFALQTAHYRKYYYDAEFSIIESKQGTAGRIYLFRNPQDIRIVDISLFPAFRNQKLGERVLRSVFAEAAQAGQSVSIHVELFNPARRLYERLGFVEQSRDGVYALMSRTC